MEGGRDLAKLASFPPASVVRRSVLNSSLGWLSGLRVGVGRRRARARSADHFGADWIS